MICWDNQNKYVWGKDREEDLLELFNESTNCLQTRVSLNIPVVTVQFSLEGGSTTKTAVRVSIQVEKSIWFYAWSKISDWEIRALTKSEPYRWVSLNIQKSMMSGSINKSRKINLAFMHQIKQNFLPQNKFFKDKYFIGIIITSLSHWDENSQLYLF